VDQFVIGAADGTAFDSGDYGFILTKGYTTILATDSIAAGASVSSGTGAAGALVASADTDINRAGVVLVTAANADTDGAVIWLNGI
jgi:hypothetical protein